MATCELAIEKNTAHSSDSNSKEASKKTWETNQRIYNYTANIFSKRAKQDSAWYELVTPLENLQACKIEITGVDGVQWICSNFTRQYLANEEIISIGPAILCWDTNSLSQVLIEDIHYNIGQIGNIFEIGKKPSNLEEEPKESEPVIYDEYSIDGISLYSDETQIFQRKIEEIRKKYGIS